MEGRKSVRIVTVCPLILGIAFGLFLSGGLGCKGKKGTGQQSITSQNKFSPKDVEVTSGQSKLAKVNLKDLSGSSIKRSFEKLKKVFGWNKVVFKPMDAPFYGDAKEVSPWEAVVLLCQKGGYLFQYDPTFRKMIIRKGRIPYVHYKVVQGFLIGITKVTFIQSKAFFDIDLYPPPAGKKRFPRYPSSLKVEVKFDQGSFVTAHMRPKSSFDRSKWNGWIPGNPKTSKMAFKISFTNPSGTVEKKRELRLPLNGNGAGKGVVVKTLKTTDEGSTYHSKAEFLVGNGWEMRGVKLVTSDKKEIYPKKSIYQLSFDKMAYEGELYFPKKGTPLYMAFQYASASGSVSCSFPPTSLEQLTQDPNPPVLYGTIQIQGLTPDKLKHFTLVYSSFPQTTHNRRVWGEFSSSIRYSRGTPQLEGYSFSHSYHIKGKVDIKIVDKVFYFSIRYIPRGKYYLLASLNHTMFIYPQVVLAPFNKPISLSISTKDMASIHAPVVDRKSGRILKKSKIRFELLNFMGNYFKNFFRPDFTLQTDEKGFLHIPYITPASYLVYGSRKKNKFYTNYSFKGIKIRFKKGEIRKKKIEVNLPK